MAEIGKLFVRLGLKSAEYTKGMQNSTLKMRLLEKGTKSANKALKGLSLGFKAVGIAAAASAGIAVYKLQKIGRESIALANIQEDAEAKLRAVIKATGQAAGITANEMIKFAASLEATTTVGDELTIQGMAILATFKNIRGEAFERTTKSALDMATIMKQDVLSAFSMIAKAMNDPIANLSAMTKAGVKFTDEQKEMIKSLWESGKYMEAQKIILRELESQFVGAAAAIRETFGGAVIAAANAQGSLYEEIGFAITKSKAWIGLAKTAEGVFIRWTEAVKKLRKEGKLDEWSKQMAIVVVQAFGTMTKAAGFFAKKIPQIRLLFASFVKFLTEESAKTLKNNIKSFEKNIERIERKISKLSKKNLSLFGRLENIEELKQDREKYTEWIEKANRKLEDVKINIEAANMMAEDSAKQIENIDNMTKLWLDEIDNIIIKVSQVEGGFSNVAEQIKIAATESKKIKIPPSGKISEGMGITYMPNYNIPQIPLNFAQNLINIFSQSGEVFKGSVDSAGKIMMESGQSTSTIIKGAGEAFGMSSLAASASFVVAIGEAVIKILGVLEEIINLPKRIVDAFTSLFTTIGDFGKLLTDAFNNLIKSVPYMLDGLIDVFTQLIPKLITLVPELMLAFYKAIPKLIKGVLDSIPLIIDATINQLPRLWIEIFAQIPKIAEALIKGIVSAPIDIVSGISSSIGDIFGDIGDSFTNIFQSIFGGKEHRTHIGGEITAGYRDDQAYTDIYYSHARKLGAAGIAASESAMQQAATFVLDQYSEIVGTMGVEFQKTFYENVQDISVSVFARASHGDRLQRRFSDALVVMADELTEYLNIYLGDAVRLYGQTAITTINQMSLGDFLAPSAEIFGLSKDLQKKLLDSADFGTEELTELVKQIDALSDAANKAVATWQDVQWQIKVITGRASELDQALYSLHGSFDKWIDQMVALGASEATLLKIELQRQKAIERIIDLEAARVSGEYQSLLDRVQTQQQQIERRDWGISDYEQAIIDLTYQMDTSSVEYYTEAIDLYMAQLSLMDKIGGDVSTISSTLVSALGAISGSIEDLMLTEMAAVQSVEAYQQMYADLVSGIAATSDPELMAEMATKLSSFLPKYLEFMGAYGMDYNTLVSQVLSDLGETQAAMVMAGLETFGTEFADMVPALDWAEYIKDPDISQYFTDLQAIEQNTADTVDALTGDAWLADIAQKLENQIALMKDWVILEYLLISAGSTLDEFLQLVKVWQIEEQRQLEEKLIASGSSLDEFLQLLKFWQTEGISSPVNTEAISESVARHIDTSPQNIEVKVFIDGREIRNVVVDGLQGRDTELINAVRKAA